MACEPRDAQERAVARDHEVHRRELVGRERLQLVGRHRRRMGDDGREARREPLDLRGPVGEQRGRGHEQARRCFVACLAALHEEQREHLDGLAEAHVVGEAGAEAEPRQQVEPADADLLIGPQRAVQLAAGVDLREPLGRAQPLEGLGEPGAGDHARPVRVGAVGRAVLGDVRAGEHAHRLGEGEPAFGREPLGLPEPLHRPLEPLPIDLDPLAADERQPVRRRPGAPSPRRGSAVSPSSVTSMRKSSSASLPSPAGALPPTVAVTCGRGGRPARQVAGMRTTTPARSSSGTSPRKRNASCGDQRSGWKISPASTICLSQAQRSAARWTGEQEREEPLLVGRARVLAQRLAERQVLGLAVRREPAGVGREKGEGRLLVLAVLGEVEVHPPDEVPGRVQALEEVLDRGLRLGELAWRRPSPSSLQSARSTSAVRYSAPGITGAAEASDARSSSAGDGGTSTLVLLDVRPRAECGDVAVAELPPVGEDRRQDLTDLGGPEPQEPVPGPSTEGLPRRARRAPGSSSGASSDGASQRRPCGVRQGVRRSSSRRQFIPSRRGVISATSHTQGGSAH